jgi:hypothetical protein
MLRRVSMFLRRERLRLEKLRIKGKVSLARFSRKKIKHL